MFSFIVFFDEMGNERIRRKFFSKLSTLDYKKSGFEFIFVVENKREEIIDEIQKFQEKNEEQIIKFIYSSKKITFDKVLQKANNLITNEYILVITSETQIDKDELINTIKLLEDNNLDILEFRPSINGIIKWDPNDRLEKNEINKLLKVSEYPNVISFSFPFMFNKIISSSLLNKTIKTYSSIINETNYSNFLFSKILYLLFLNVNNYWYYPKIINETKLNEDCWLNFNDVINVFNSLQKIYEEKNEFTHEIKYAKLFYLKIILCSIYAMQGTKKIKKMLFNKNDVVKSKYYDKLNFIIDKEFKNFSLDNKYMVLSGSNEMKLLKESQSISKWNKLLKSLEE